MYIHHPKLRIFWLFSSVNVYTSKHYSSLSVQYFNKLHEIFNKNNNNNNKRTLTEQWEKEEWTQRNTQEEENQDPVVF